MASVYSGRSGKYVSIEETVEGFREIVDGECDDIPEDRFYMVGNIEEVKGY